MAETALITKADILEFYPIGKNINSERVDPHIIRAQQSELKSFLGDALYYDVVTNPATVPNAKLLNGGEYTNDTHTIFFSGVKALLASWAYARIEKKNSVFVTRGGNVKKETEESIQMTNNEIDAEKSSAESEAIRLQKEVWVFLDTNRTTYPLFETFVTGQNRPKKTSMEIKRV